MKKFKFAAAAIAVVVAMSAFTTDNNLVSRYWYESDDVTFDQANEAPAQVADLEATRPGLDFSTTPGTGYTPYQFGYATNNPAGDPEELIYAKDGI